MTEACYMARATTKQQDLNSVNELMLQTNEHGKYTHNANLLLQKGIWYCLLSCPPCPQVLQRNHPIRSLSRRIPQQAVHG
jgi:hypothetical protein